MRKKRIKKVLNNIGQKTDFNEVKYVAEQLKRRHWNYQKMQNKFYCIKMIFSYYDNMLDTTISLGEFLKDFKT